MKRARPSKARRRSVLEKYQKWLLVLLVLAAAAAVTMVFLFANSELRTELPEDSYQHTLGKPNHYPAGTRLIESDRGLQIETKKGRASTDATPFYAEDHPRILLTRDTCWVDASSPIEARIPALSTIEIDESGAIWCRIDGKSYPLTGGILTDGRGTVVFLDKVQLSVNGVFRDLPALSFYSDVGGVCRVWAYGEEEGSREKDLYLNTMVVSSLGYKVDLTAGIYTGADGVRRLLSRSPDGLLDLPFYI